jgi:hypothetical protein
MTGEGRQTLGYGLLAGAGGIAVLLLLWLAVSGVQASGFVLGLVLLFVLAGPLAGAGWYVLARGRADVVAEQAFVGKRRVIEADRLFRGEVTAELRRLAAAPGVPRDRLLRIADGLERAAADESAWYDAIQLDDAQTAVLNQYDDLAWARVRWLRDHADETAVVLDEAMDDLQVALDQRSDLLLRGQLAPTVAPGALLQAAQPHARESKALASIALGDAVTHEGTDYLVEGLATSFAEGQTTKLAHLVPSGANAEEHWLAISAGGFEFGWLQSITPPEPGTKQLVHDGSVLDQVDSSSAMVHVDSTAGAAPGVLVRSWTYRAGPRLGLVEQWPDQSVHAYAGRTIAARELEVWPATESEEVLKNTP